MPSAHPSSAARILLTGATGFLGKVVLEELLRQRDTLGVEKVIVLIRAKKGASADERFRKDILASACFKNLPANWADAVEVISGDLGELECALSPATRARLQAQITHVIHCAASVDFDLPIATACNANIDSALNILELARGCPALVRMVGVSTAYVMAHRGGTMVQSFQEELAPLPYPAASIYEQITTNSLSEAKILQETGHPNTYTLTKCVSEHLLMERRGQVPLTIVRPSIISASWRHPFPGWIDSSAAFAGFVAAIGSGYLHVVDANPQRYLDIMPCDEVAARVIDNAFVSARSATPKIQYAVAGIHNSSRIDHICQAIVDFFARNPTQQRAELAYVGQRGWRFAAHHVRRHALPLKAGQAVFRLTRNDKMARIAKRLEHKLHHLNRIFPYFTHSTFDFRTSAPLDSAFRISDYIAIACDGVYEHLLKNKPQEVSLGGRQHQDRSSDLLWAMRQPYGNLAIRISAGVLRKVLRRGFEQVTFDQRSFERALAQVGEADRLVVVPTHRSYMDFLVCSYLFFARPTLGIQIPHIAAAQEFSQVRGVGWLFSQMQAFYLQRGVGKEDPELTRTVHELVKSDKTLQFFIEGARSRSRQFLQPRRGLLRCMQTSGESFTVLPVSVSYDRVPEEMSFLRELKGQPKQAMRLRSLLRWATQLSQGKMQLGRLHIRCGEPLYFDGGSDAHQTSLDIMEQLQKHVVSTTYHLRAFADAHPDLGFDTAWLRRAIEERGGVVLDSGIAAAHIHLDGVLERCLRYHWIHLFADEARARHRDNPALLHYTRENTFVPGASHDGVSHDAQTELLLATLFEPVCSDYIAVARAVKRLHGKQTTSTAQLLRHANCVDHSVAQGAVRALVEHEILQRLGEGDQYRLGPRISDLHTYIDRSGWTAPARTIRQRTSNAVVA